MKKTSKEDNLGVFLFPQGIPETGDQLWEHRDKVISTQG